MEKAAAAFSIICIEGIAITYILRLEGDNKLIFKLHIILKKMGQTQPLFGLFSLFFTTQGQISL